MKARALPGIVVIVLLAGLLTYGSKVAVAELTKPQSTAESQTETVTQEQPTGGQQRVISSAGFIRREFIE